jgi:histidinol-phosphatase (PHP family)
MYDTHVHTTFSPDGISPMEAYAALIDEGRLEGIGFAEHLDFMPECGAYGFFRREEYLSSIKAYNDKDYKFFAGVEIDYNKKIEQEILQHLRDNKYDFSICSVHMIHGLSVSDRTSVEHFADPQTFRTLVDAYYREIACTLTVPEFQVIGHAGIYKRYLEESFYEQYKFTVWIRELDHALAKLCARSDKILEVNTSGLFAHSCATVPNREFLKLYHSYGGRMVSIGSDAHNVAHAGRGIDTALRLLAEIGFGYIYLPWDREEPVKIS